MRSNFTSAGRAIAAAAAFLLMIPIAPRRCSAAAAASRPAAPFLSAPYLDLVATYAVYARSIWHEDGPGVDAGGYFGVGVDPAADQNGAVRATCNTILADATLIAARDRGWMDRAIAARLDGARLDRAALLRYIVQDLRYLAAHHVSNPRVRRPAWGQSWQSPLWVGAMGTAAILIWPDLPPEVQAQVKALTASEADRIAATAPGDYRPGDTKAEENGWDSQAPAIALALDPQNAHAAAWWRAARRYAVNTCSVRADRRSDAMVGTDRVKAIVTTANLFDDFTLENHGFFHPDYVQVSGQELGEAWLMLELGDALHGTDYGKRFKPYALHHAAQVWERVARPLVLPDGEFTFPAGTDWTVNCGVTPSYLAYVATGLNDRWAAAAARQEVQSSLRRRAASPPGHVLGDSNLAWFWEPLLAKRCCTALLQYAMRPSPDRARWDAAPAPTINGQWLWPDAGAWAARTGDYFVSLSWGSKVLGTFTPLGYAGYPQHPYSTLPVPGGILPQKTAGLLAHRQIGDAQVMVLRLAGGQESCALVALPHSVLWISPRPLQPIGIENDRLVGERTLRWSEGSRQVEALHPMAALDLPGGWVNVDDEFTFISTAQGFRYQPAGTFNRTSAAIDKLCPRARCGAWQMLAASSAPSPALARDFEVKFDGNVATITLRDGPAGKRYQIRADLNGKIAPTAQRVSIEAAR